MAGSVAVVVGMQRGGLNVVVVQGCGSAECAVHVGGGGTCVSTCTRLNDKSLTHNRGLISLHRLLRT